MSVQQETEHVPLCVLGTYNSQYMVVDLSKVSLGHSIRDGALTVVEQIPGKVMHSDQTQALRRGEKQTSIYIGFVRDNVSGQPPLLCYIWQVTGHPTTYRSMLKSTT